MRTEEPVIPLSKLPDEEIIAEGVKRLFAQYKKRGGEKYDHVFDVAFVITLNYRDEFTIALERRQKFYASQPALKLLNPIL